MAEQASGLLRSSSFFSSMALGRAGAEQRFLVVGGLRQHVLAVHALGGVQADVVGGEVQLGRASR